MALVWSWAVCSVENAAEGEVGVILPAGLQTWPSSVESIGVPASSTCVLSLVNQQALEGDPSGCGVSGCPWYCCKQLGTLCHNNKEQQMEGWLKIGYVNDALRKGGMAVGLWKYCWLSNQFLEEMCCGE